MRKRARFTIRVVAVGLAAAAVLALPAAGVEGESKVAPGFLSHLSQAVQQRFLAAHPDEAPARLHGALAALSQVPVQSHNGPAGLTSFNRDDLGLPQNEESVGVCREDPRNVLGGTNDYRGLLDPEGNFTGWHFSNDGGQTLTNEGLLPSIDGIPSGGDPVDVGASHCSFYAGGLHYFGDNPFTRQNGIGVERSDAATLASCDPNDADSCWPTRRIVAMSPNPPGPGIVPTPANPAFFFDKPWFDVGRSGSAGEVVWIVYSDFRITGPGTDTLDYTVTLEAVRCTADLAACTQPQVLSGEDQDIQFGDVTIGPDGRVYVTWVEIVGELPGEGGQPSQPQTFIVKSRVAEPGSTTFGPVHVVATVDRPIPFGGFLQADDFRVATYPKNTVVNVGGKTRYFVTWDECKQRPLDTICEEPVIKLSYSDDLGVTWSEPTVISHGGVNFFPTIAGDPTNNRVVIAWYTNRFDSFDHRYDVELVSFPGNSANPGGSRRLTRQSNEPDADPLLGGFFIGDYFEVVTHGGAAWVHFNANYREEKLLDGLIDEGVPVNQQDNFLIRVGS